MNRSGDSIQMGRYLLGERLAVGGMGEVYLALQLGLGDYQKPLAMKLLLPHLAEDARAVQGFLDEARVAARMNHRNIVQIFDVGLEAGRYYLAMELVRGISLARLLRALERNQTQLTPDLLSHLARSMCDALAHAHQQRGHNGEAWELVHRDVSPQNVLVSEDGEVKLTDFGIAKVLNSSMTRSGEVKGKCEYLAPEQLTGAVVDRRADLFSLGVTLFQAATLRSPFRRDTAAVTIRAVLEDSLPLLSTLRGDLPASFMHAIETVTDKNPAARPATAMELKDLLPEPSSQAAVALGELVHQHFGEALQMMEKQTSHLKGRFQHTETATVSEGLLPALPVPSAAKASRWPSVIAAVSLLMALGGLGWGLAQARARSESLASSAASTAVPSVASTAAMVAPGSLSAMAVAAEARIAATPVRITETGGTPGATPNARSASNSTAGGSRAVALRAARRVGYLTIDAVPWANVSVHGRTIGDTPLFRFPLEEGTAQLLLRNPETGRSQTRRVRIVAGGEARLKVDLR